MACGLVGVSEFPGGELAGGSVETFGDGDVSRGWWHSGEGFTVERVGGRVAEPFDQTLAGFTRMDGEPVQ